MKRALFTLVMLALGATWWLQRLSAAHLEAAIDAQRRQARALSAELRERDRLRAQQPGDQDWRDLQHTAGERGRLQALLDAQATPQAVAISQLPLGEWSPATRWRNRGQATPQAALETALWAAAGGDVASLRQTLFFGEETRTKAEALLAQLSSAARERYATSEDLVAEFTVKSIPLGWAQLVWFNQNGEDTATAGLFLQHTAPGDAAAAPATPPPPLTRDEAVRLAAQRKAEREANPDRPPPQTTDDRKGSVIYITFQRTNDDWHLVVPPDAIDKIAKDLNGAPTH